MKKLLVLFSILSVFVMAGCSGRGEDTTTPEETDAQGGAYGETTTTTEEAAQ